MRFLKTNVIFGFAGLICFTANYCAAEGKNLVNYYF